MSAPQLLTPLWEGKLTGLVPELAVCKPLSCPSNSSTFVHSVIGVISMALRPGVDICPSAEVAARAAHTSEIPKHLCCSSASYSSVSRLHLLPAGRPVLTLYCSLGICMHCLLASVKNKAWEFESRDFVSVILRPACETSTFSSQNKLRRCHQSVKCVCPRNSCIHTGKRAC